MQNSDIKEKDISTELKNELPLIPLDEVLECMKDSDPVVAAAGRKYYALHYIG